MTTQRRPIDWDTLSFCVTWALLAILAWQGAGITVGLVTLFGPLPLVALVTWIYLIRAGNIRATRVAHWAVLGLVTAMLALYLLA
jgi:hypothetical protein